MRISRKYLILFLVFSGFMMSNCEKSNEKGEEVYRSVILTSPIPIGNSTFTEYSGVIEEGKNVTASFMADGKIKNILVKEGDRVRKGQLIATLDDTDYQIGVNQLRAQLDQMTMEKQRMDEMFSRHNIAPNDYEKFSAGYEQLKLQMDMAENKLGYTKLYAPAEGYVSEKLMESGELVGAGTSIVKITDDSSLTANVDLPVAIFLNKDKIKSVKGFTPVYPESEIPLNEESFTPDVTNNMLYHMKLMIPAKYISRLSPGMNIRVGIEMEETQGYGDIIPVRALINESEKAYVWVYNSSDSTIHKKMVNVTGIPKGNSITVTGLDGSEEIVETGVKQLYEGEKVHIVNNSDFSL